MRTFIALVVLTLCVITSPVLRWWNPVLIPINRRAFTVEDFQQFEVMEKEKKREQRDVRAAETVFKAQCGGSYSALGILTAEISRNYHLPPKVLASVIVAESTCRTNAVSEAGAVGLMQVMPQVWGVPKKELLDPDKNLQEGTKILARYVKQTGNVRDGLRHYFGVTEGSTAADEYADRVLEIAKR